MAENTDTPSSPPDLLTRAKAILLTPREEWARIDGEADTVGAIFRRYVIPLAALPVLAGLIGALAFGHSVFGVTFRPSAAGAVAGAVVQYALTLLGVFVVALIIDALAPTFQATRDRVQAYKIAAYSATASWLAGVFVIFPPIALLSILGLYSLYLLYLGLPRLMRAPQEKALPYTIIVVIAAVAVSLAAGAVAAPVMGLFGGGLGGSSRGEVAGSVKLPGGGSVDLGKLEEASRQMEEAAKRIEAGAGGDTVAVEPAQLEAMLPASVAGLERVEISSSSTGAGGMVGSRAEAHYRDGDRVISLEIGDLAAMSGLAALGSAFDVQSNRQTATGYERVGRVDGRMTTEEWNSESRDGAYSVLVGDRFMVRADGQGVEMDALKAAVRGLDLKALDRIAAAGK